MDRLKKFIKSAAFKWSVSYTVFIIAATVVASALTPDTLTGEPDKEESAAIDTVDVKKTSLKNEPPGKKKNTVVEKSEEKIKSEARINALIKKHDAVVFKDLDYLFTIDYQENLKRKNVLFYIFIEDIFEENRHIYIKTRKTLGTMNVYLKLNCDDIDIKKLKEFKFFVYVVGKVSEVSKVFFNTKAKIPKSESRTESEAVIAFDTMDEGLLIQGECIEIIEELN